MYKVQLRISNNKISQGQSTQRAKMRQCRILQSMQHTRSETKERELSKCIMAVKECIRGGGRNLQGVIFKH